MCAELLPLLLPTPRAQVVMVMLAAVAMSMEGLTLVPVEALSVAAAGGVRSPIALRAPPSAHPHPMGMPSLFSKPTPE